MIPIEDQSLDAWYEFIIRTNYENFPNWEKIDYPYWTTCLAGEVGELCNVTKKHDRWKRGWRGKKMDKETFLKESFGELGDIFVYWALMCHVWGFDPVEVIRGVMEKNLAIFGEAKNLWKHEV